VTEEVVGDGDTAAEFQEFALRKKPLTFVPSADPGGVRSSLALAVNGARWNEVSSLYAQGPTAQVYTTRIDDEGITTVEFGDGKNGARVPSGRTNIKATYRQGSGLAGRVAADALRTLLDRPTGLKAVTNPDRTEGGADPESMDQARQNAPTTVRTFERAVSLQDFEDLVTTSGEVAKAKATWVWNGEARVIHLTVAGQQGDVFSDEALGRIHASLDRQRDPNHRLLLANFSRVAILVGARLRLDDAHVAEEVEASARSTLLDALSFEALNFGQPVHLSDIYRVLQEVTGVVAVDIERLHFKSRTPEYLAERGATTDAVQGHLRVYAARPSAAPVRFVAPAEQAWIEQPDRDIRLVTSGGLPS
jgi:predicted phage baseplate assembly protein